MSCCHGILITEQALCDPEPTLVCADCGRVIEPDAPTLAEGGYVEGHRGPVLMRVDPDEPTMTAAEVQATGVLHDVTLYRFDPEPECEHGATLTFRTGVIGGHHVTFDAPLTYCLECRTLAPTPQEDPQP